jgi:hypothetical protein
MATARPMPEFGPITKAFCPTKLLGMDRDGAVEAICFSFHSVGHAGLAMSWGAGGFINDLAKASAAILIALA